MGLSQVRIGATSELTLGKRLALGAGLFLGSIMILGMVVALSDEAVRLYRGWRNTSGSVVPGYGLYEKQYSSPVLEKELQKAESSSSPETKSLFRSERGWELIDFYQWEVFCHFHLRPKERAWIEERKRLLAVRGGFSMVLPKDVLAEIWSSTAPHLSADDPLRKVLYLKG